MPVSTRLCPHFFGQRSVFPAKGCKKARLCAGLFPLPVPSGGSGRLLLLVVFVDFLEVGIDDVTVLGGISLGVGLGGFLL